MARRALDPRAAAPYDAAAVEMKTRASVLFWILAAAPAAHAEPIRLTGIAAIANDSIVTIQEVDRASASARDGLLRAYGNKPEQLQIETFKAQSDALEHLIERRLILDDFKNSGLVYPESIISDQVNDIIRTGYGNRAALIRELQHDGMTSESFIQRLREDRILDAMTRRNVKDQLIISPARIEAYYQTNLAKYKLNDQVKLRVIELSRDALESSDATTRTRKCSSKRKSSPTRPATRGSRRSRSGSSCCGSTRKKSPTPVRSTSCATRSKKTSWSVNAPACATGGLHG